MLQYIIPVIATAIVSYTVNSSVKVISQGDEALVERLGKYRRTLKPGLQFVVPLVERITYVDTIRERVLDIPEQSVITNDNLTLKVDAVLYWQIIDIERAYYAIENVENAIQEIVLTSLRSQIGRLPLRQVLSTKDDIDKALLKKLDEATYNWGVKVIRVEIQNIVFPEKLRIAMESERVALSQKQTVLSKAQAEAESIKLLSETLNLSPDSPEFIKFLIAQRYIEINHKLSESANSKVVFMHPRTMSEGVGELIGEYPDDGEIELKKVD
ncbi:SPFH domain, Band 7 family protein [Trichodesmium erythraeum IMS101]|uniref:SPFH domain, Band 7 family protein n=1 Tax=Trichodesmium erythraeum (strain IMS101) TaxID=203124 RepID=Q10X38_TRIEI|nr:paraslipin [Trichodesmium erythraeum GBRTRLIN201]MCH2049847.1 paraslipin [Trichodesmium sp. ALOHA_ZT_67]MDE5094177.1 SPFH domain-containing protein [Trichodesmium sp. St11_bin5]MDT9337954.1 SPFH domain-containing protein [Trichodesmium erythraeum 21-75]